MTVGPGRRGAGERRLQEASHWFSRHESGGELSATDLREWDAWIAEPGNSAEYDEFVRTQWHLKTLPRPSLPSDAQLQACLSRDSTGLRRLAALQATQSPSRRSLSALRFMLSAMTACAAALAAVAFVGNVLLPGRLAPDPGQVYLTAPGEQRDFVLKDGSVVILAGDSSLSVRFTPTRRTAVLDHGEARFQVRHDRSRAFTVLAGPGSITAVGTVFDVRRYSDRVLVMVSEGAVEVAPRKPRSGQTPLNPPAVHNTTRWAPLRVTRGQEMTYDIQGTASAAQRTDTHLATLWTEGSLAYRGRPLREVIEDVQRYSTRRIMLDPNVADLQYTGTFVQRDADQWVRGLARIFPVEVVEAAPNIVVIRSRPAGQQEAGGNGAR